MATHRQMPFKRSFQKQTFVLVGETPVKKATSPLGVLRLACKFRFSIAAC